MSGRASLPREVTRPHAGTRRAKLDAIELDGVSIRFGRHWVLRDLSCRLNAGERWLLTGANGSGKTVLLRLMRGELWPTPTGRERRRYRIGGEWEEQPLDVRRRIAYLGPEQQDRYERYGWNLPVADVVATGLFETPILLDIPSARQLREVRRALADVGLAGLAVRRFLTLSQGQRRRVLLARALVSRPDVLLLDEVLNGLDTASRRAFVRSLRKATLAGATWVLSTHRAADRPAGVTHVARLDRGRLVVREVDGRDAIRRRGHRRKGGDAAVGSANKRAAPSQAPLLRLSGVDVYRDGRRILHGIDWTVDTGQHWAVTGPNGSGKSTLFALLYGDLHASLGGGLLRDGVAPGTPIEEWKHRVGFVSPELQATYAATACTVEEIVASGVHSSIGLNERPSAAELAHARSWIDRVGLQGLGRRRARQLSYGQLRLALFARALIVPRQVLLLDEPFDGLDASSRAIAERVVGAAVEQGAQIILGTHHVEDIPAFIRHRLDLRDGTARARRAN